jgi:hypothetical protein
MPCVARPLRRNKKTASFAFATKRFFIACLKRRKPHAVAIAHLPLASLYFFRYTER